MSGNDPQRVPLNGQIYDALRGEILDGDISPGSRLSEPQLARRFETSRSPIRDAVARLEQEGYVSRSPSGRIFVSTLNMRELRYLYEVRSVNEGLAAGLAARRLSGMHLEALARCLEGISHYDRLRRLDASLRQGEQFHDIIHRNCGNPYLCNFLVELRHKIFRYRSIIAVHRDPTARKAEHDAVLRALEKRDPEAAERAMRHHIEASAESLPQADDEAAAS